MVKERVVSLDQYEFNAVIKLINDRRNDLLKENKNAEFITEILTKVIDAPSKKKCIFKRKGEKCER